MPPYIYHIAHLVGLIVLFVGIGGLAGGHSKSAMKYQGIGLVILLVAGFGFIASTNKAAGTVAISYTSPFIIAKVVIFLVLGFLPVLVKRKALSGGAVVWIAVVLGGCAAYLGYLKALPF